MASVAIAKLENSATGKALDAVVRGTAVLDSFVDFTTNLVEDVFNALTNSSIDQLEAYGELVAKVSGTLADYQARTVGDLDAAAAGYINDVVLASFSPANTTPPKVLYEGGTLSQNPTGTSLTFDVDHASAIKSLFVNIYAPRGASGADILIDHLIDEYIDAQANTTTIVLNTSDVHSFAKEKIRRDVKTSYDTLVTILKLGMQKLVVTGGQISTKLTFHVESQESDELSSTVTQVDASQKSSSFSYGLSASYGSRLARFAGARSFGARGSLGGGRSKSSSSMRVSVVNEKHTAATSLSVDVVGAVQINFRSDFFPAFDPAATTTPTTASATPA
ncbi:hypothetical protein WME76_24500 [Sorangium sp. So ce119]|uniref:hypothetical protein n=1 Tax=Sorangium sp. So ce119 TaxID=3133279 RepID=UPI003F5E1BE5